MITNADIEKLAKLARIEVSPNEVDSYRSKIDGVLGYIDQIKSVAGTLPDPMKEPIRNVMRPDENPNKSGACTECILAEAPASEKGYLSVKKILAQ